MKKITLLCFVIPILILIHGCKGDAGPTGTTGTNGTSGDTFYLMEFQQGVYPSDSYSGCSDAFIASAPAYANENFGTCYLLVTGSSSGSWRSVIKYDLTNTLPSGAVIDSAYLTFYIDGGTSASNTVTAYALTRGFTEGTGGCAGAGVADSNVSWLYYAGSSYSWTNAGGDYLLSNPSSSVIINNTMQCITLKLDASVVQGWLDTPAANYGLVLIAQNETTGSVWHNLYSSDEASPTLRPKLAVYYKL